MITSRHGNIEPATDAIVDFDHNVQETYQPPAKDNGLFHYPGYSFRPWVQAQLT
jgi:hypothetical protein